MANKPTDVFLHINMMGGDRQVCWPWKGSINKSDSRPYFTVAGKRRTAYALVIELASGELQGTRVARHSCDNPICCNPAHLSWGTPQDNSNDMKDRERHGLSKIVVRAIKTLLLKGTTHEEIADRYGLSREAITKINNNMTHQAREAEKQDSS